MPEPLSPCNGVCRIDEPTAQCLGCRRTRDEIAAWPALSLAGKREVLRRLEARAVNKMPRALRDPN